MYKQILLSAAAVGLLGLAACDEEPTGPTLQECDPFLTTFGTVAHSDTVTTASGLRYLDVRTGTGATAAGGTVADVHYSGYLTNGTQFDSSCPSQETLQFQLGAGGLIPGFEQGVSGMRTGGIRRLIIPPALGYGNQPVRSIPAGSTLIFDIELVDAD